MRFLSFVWPIVFFIPLTDFAGRYCWLTGIDPVYHALVFTHEYMPQILFVYAIASAIIVIVSDAHVRGQLQHLASLAVPTPAAIHVAINDEASSLAMIAPECAYLNVPQSFCFTANGDRRIMLSRGFVSSLSVDDLRLAIRHELVHLKRSHSAKALAWRIATRAMLLPGFQAIDRWRHARREEIADRETAGKAVKRYRRLLVRSSAKNGTMKSALLSWRLRALREQRPILLTIWPALVAALLFIALVSSHFIFLTQMQFLITHHC